MWSINKVLESAALKYGGRTAIIDGDQHIAFDTLEMAVRQAAGWLQSRGVRKGDKVAIQGYNSFAWVVGFYATLFAGGVVVPLNHKLVAAETAYILDHSDARLWLVDDALYQALTADQCLEHPAAFALNSRQANPILPAFAPADERHTFSPVEVLADDLAELLYTSGTTGRPKGCMHSHANALLAGIGSSLVYGLGPADRMLIAMPVWHSFPLNNLLLNSLYVGASVVLLPEYEPRHFLETIQNKLCTAFFGAPIAYILPIKTIPDFDDYDLSSMRIWLYGGGPIDAETARCLTKRYRSDRFYQVFGMTETGPTGTALWPDEQQSKAGSIGRHAVPGCDLTVMRNETTAAAAGETGEIWLRCQSMMQGYYRDAEATAEAFCGSWYRTGDLAHIDEDGYLFIVDRLKDMIVTGGENVYSREVEDVLSQHPMVSEVAVIGTPHPDWGESVTAFIVPMKENQAMDVDDVQAYCRSSLAEYKLPRIVKLIDSIPRTPTGKIMKYRLRDEKV